MCGIAGAVSLSNDLIPDLEHRLRVMNDLIAHRGPDDDGIWMAEGHRAGLAHRRLSIIDVTSAGHQPMEAQNGATLVFNGEIYNFVELRSRLSRGWSFRSRTDTEVILAAYQRFGPSCVDQLRGMFAFALWDGERLFCARDRFGIKPFYFTVVDQVMYFASEIKALLPFLPAIETSAEGLAEYLVFQYTLGERTMFAGVHQLLPGHALEVKDGRVHTYRYWDVHYSMDLDHTPQYFAGRLNELVRDSLDIHLRSDVEVGAYVSGGIDSSLVATLASEIRGEPVKAFHGKFTDEPGYDESEFARLVCAATGSELFELDITVHDLVENLPRLIYHLDQPMAGPGSFPQFMVSRLAAEHVKVVLGGQGGDEIFGGYARYLIAYLEQCIRAAIDGTYNDGNFVVTAESIIPNMTVLQEYRPLIQRFWADGLFGPLDERYFKLIDRSTELTDEIDWSELDTGGVFERFHGIFTAGSNLGEKSYFDRMTHFDFKCLLPALLHVEDRMSMAHGLEARVPLLDHPLIEFLATVPADIKFEDGKLKHLVKQGFDHALPAAVLDRRNKMGFPVPLAEWSRGPLREFLNDVFRSSAAGHRPFLNARNVIRHLDEERPFGRKLWGLLSLELWHTLFHDQGPRYRRLLTEHPARSEA